MSAVKAQRAESPLVLALDIGTSWVRGVLFDRLGRIVKGLEALGMLPAVEQAPEFIRGVCEPDPPRNVLYRKAMDRQRQVYNKLVPQGLGT